MGENRTEGTARNVVAMAAGDVGTAANPGQKVLDVGNTGDPSAVWITSIYGIATAAGKVILYHSVDPTVVGTQRDDAAATNYVYSLWITATGDGITGVKIGPFTEDIYVSSDTTSTLALGALSITYEAVGQV